jgi:dihydroorotase-like cyclic amidohydrolase
MVECRAARAEEMAHERAVLLAIACEEANEVAQRVFTLEGKLGAARQACGAAEEKLLSLAAQAVAADRRRVGVEEQCEHLVHELTLLSRNWYDHNRCSAVDPPTRGDAI